MAIIKRIQLIMSKQNSPVCHAIAAYAILPAIALLLGSCSLDQLGSPNVARITITASADSNGTVSVFPVGGKVAVGSEAVVTAAANSGYVFIGFFGDVRSTANPLRIIASKNVSVTARFAKRPGSAQMVEIRSAGAVFLMGSKSGMSYDIERPPHPVRFTYAYFMDKCEVTQGMYRTLMGTNPSTANATQGTFGVGDSFPVYYVTWYDAALFCNARSKIDGYDTVYSYDAVCPTAGACPYMLENLEVHYDRMGYRLPTEAEWEYACRAGTTSDYFWGDSTADSASAGAYAWNSTNARGTTHPVGHTRPNAFGLFDMAGNVSELVEDWLAPYPDSPVTNTIGPTNLTLEQFEATYERPVRGGCFQLGTSFLRSSSRSEEPYKAPALVTSPHIGFRTVLGVFFPDTSGRPQVHASDTLGITVTCAKSDLSTFVGTSSLKIAFVKDNGIRRRGCYIDFTSPAPAVRLIGDTATPFGPRISPNGAYVAYGSKDMGFSSPSQTTVWKLGDSLTPSDRTSASASAYFPSWWVDTATGDTCLVCAEAATMDNDPQWISQRTLLWHCAAGKISASPQVVTAKGSFNGGFSKNGMYLATGYPRAYLYDVKENFLSRYFLPPYSGTNTDTIQVCNVSISPSISNPDQLMFLDFGYSKTSTVVGKPYEFHSIIFICNSCVACPNHVQKWFEKPSGFAEWDDVKWSNHPDFAAAIAKQSSGSYGTLYLISLKDSSYLKVAQGDGLCDPYLWIDPAQVSEFPDPYADFAKYDVPMEGNYGSQLTITEKLKLFWKRCAAFQVAVVGSSPAYYGVDPSAIRSFPAVNMATFMGELLLSEVLAQDYFLLHSPLKGVILDLDPGFLNSNYYWSDPFLDGLHDSQGFQFDQKNSFWKAGIPAQVVSKIAALSPASWPDVDSTGYTLSRPSGGWGDTLIDKGDYAFADTFVQTNLRTVAATADTLAAHGVQLVIVNYPQNPLYKYTSSIGRYGPSRATYGLVAQWVDSLCRANPSVHFYDANNGGDHDYDASEAFDPNHLNYAGAQKLSRRLDSLLTLYVK
ncbi:MAG TPA: SUMF1/EgtB/PvdO family nonheme iron enzyme [Chitinivibrionales bacterium]|jgi:formylglycine-generating enzyme required for sulfatase activity|nr:SUMF1/EgtB/PvdO family nonheme iron enzyme [Chitinivibrionales bacterium]